ncbi:type IV pilus assembly protein FimV [Cognatazoarcus halotolerans]|uniref:acetate kinase n=1 Tax=Cognatazoarcus halotolerans TaxID=2686016 RepID=UPI00190FB50E|nr:acetate kinase [Cognatazoarcus halotolerans]MCB1910756.1 acetate kinase [Rhodocyclaceae bacterium]MCW5613772.1 acetate kinase [Rhodocyclaceae bacterium]
MSNPMPRTPRTAICLAVCAGLAGSVWAADVAAPETPTLEQLQKLIVEQTARLEALRKSMQVEEAKLAEIRRAVEVERLEATRGAGPAEPSATQPPVQVAQESSQPVGQRPPEAKREDAAPVAQIFDQPGVLTPPGRVILEPSLQYSYASTNRVALVGYTIIPAITIGLIDVREVKRNTWTAALTARTGLTNRMEFEAKIPYVYRSDDSIGRPLATPSSNEEVFNATGRKIGDVELTGRYQLNDGGPNEPYYIASLRFKMRTGSDQFDFPSVYVPNSGYLPKGLPTGSGFYSLQPGVTFLFPSDPVVFFGGINYQYSFGRSNLSLREEDLSTGSVTVRNVDSVRPGGVLGFNFGMGLALNDKSSFSVGYDHASVGRTQLTVDGVKQSGGVRVQLGTLMFGYAYRLSPTRSLNVSLGVGVTRDTPDVNLTVRMPFTL